MQTHYYRRNYVTSGVCDQNCDGPVGAYPEKQLSIPWFGIGYWQDSHADNNKTAINAKYSNCKGLNHETWRQPTKFAIAAILNFVSTLNSISIHSSSIYKLSMIRLVHMVHFDVDF